MTSCNTGAASNGRTMVIADGLPFAAIMFADTYRSISIREKPDTGETIQLALTVPEIIGCAIPSVACATLFVVFPISFLSGVFAVWRRRLSSRKQT